ncbi:MAG TPA: 3-phosphoshikimate 1-carboxyvinyltransferase [Dehalococcoidia bacterium]|nr:3-phosphoshikimate 1-carboxyvinyltransferase [Dehalococcoidia bacterium]
MNSVVKQAKRLRGSIEVPGDKSISHRAAMLNAIAGGSATIENFQQGEDCQATLNCFGRLRVNWERLAENVLRIDGVGLHGLREPSDALDCANSGTTMRLLAGLLAAQPFAATITGDESLRSRPMGRIIEPLRLMGAEISGRDDNYAPLRVQGRPLKGVAYRTPVASAQVKSSILLAGLYAEGETTVTEPTTSRDHTERMLTAMGADIRGEGTSVRVRPARQLQALSLRVPGDISAAAYWLVAACIHPDAEVYLPAVGVNPTRTGILEALRAMGADIEVTNERSLGSEPVADLTARSSQLRGIMLAGDIIPRLIDEIPLLALVAACADGETQIRDAAELRVKESDRIRTTAQELRSLGAEVEELEDGLRIQGPSPLFGAEVQSHGDHRLAMTLAVAGLAAQGATNIGNSHVVAVSYSQFWHDLQAIAGAND